MSKQFENFSEFYPYYLAEHSNRTCRRLHFVGSGLTMMLLIAILWSGHWHWAIFLPVCGYGFAWYGHFRFEKNRPATFRHPVYSLMGDCVMFKDMLIGKIKF